MEEKELMLPDEIKVSSAKKDMLNCLVSILDKYQLPNSIASLLLDSVALEICKGEMRAVSNYSVAMAQLEKKGGE